MTCPVACRAATAVSGRSAHAFRLNAKRNMSKPIRTFGVIPCLPPSLEGLRNVQRLMAQRNPAVANLKTESLVEGRIMRELDESGFIDQLYATYGVK